MDTALFDEVKQVVVDTLEIQDRSSEFEAASPLLGSVAELDSMAVLEVVVALEARFGFEIDDSELTGEVFETFGTLTDFVAEHQ
jgi:acyl carrier protein